MRHALQVLVAAFVAALMLIPSAEAAESYLGTVYSYDGGAVHNLFPTDGGAFFIPSKALVTIQPNANAYVCVDELTTAKAPTCSSVLGVKVSADTAFPSSCKSAQPVVMADGGTVTGCVVTCAPVSGSSVNCTVWQRTGNEN